MWSKDNFFCISTPVLPNTLLSKGINSMAKDSKEKDVCHPLACRLQRCLDKNNFDDQKCLKEIDAIKDCCRSHWRDSFTCCEGFLKDLGIDPNSKWNKSCLNVSKTWPETVDKNLTWDSFEKCHLTGRSHCSLHQLVLSLQIWTRLLELNILDIEPPSSRNVWNKVGYSRAMSRLRLMVNSFKRKTSSRLKRVSSAVCDSLHLHLITNTWSRMKYSFKSLLYNDHLDVSYSCDTLMEPMFWFVDNFTSTLGPVRLRFKTQQIN